MSTIRDNLLLPLLALAFAACSQSAAPAAGPDAAQALEVAEQTREGAVAESLELLAVAAERLGPLAGVRDAAQLGLFARAIGCALDEDGIVCADAENDVVVTARISIEEEVVHFELDLLGDGSVSTGQFSCVYRPETGVHFSGTFATEFADGSRVETDIRDLYGRVVADLGGADQVLRIQGGNLDIEVMTAFRPPLAGSVAVASGSALVALDVNGVHSQGAIPFGS